MAAVFFDFDSTLSSPQFLPWANDYAVADRSEIFEKMTDDEIFANFGGRERVNRLAQMLERLTDKGVTLFIISLGFKKGILRHLETVGLGRFWIAQRVYGQDSQELAQARFAKAMLIRWLLSEHGLLWEHALFVDDDDRHITLCRRSETCACLHVRGEGLHEEEINAIEARFGASASLCDHSSNATEN
eukprot:TRINITY_DN63459_c0_g1_i1.p1 TRINITY_DN63459_c0_g1~~TRINITY_DN63459_c0_g1_i1.p1  ORF type:complete len:210 (+),score=37.75 TRINITY_DN63459_c0_g1_i1:68-631(+)